MDPKTLDRIERLLRAPGIAQRLSELAPSDLQSLWLEVSHRVASGKSPADVLQAWEQNRFVQPAAHSPESFLEVAQRFFEELPADVERLELSPVAPLGGCSAVATTHQHRVVSAERGCEVVSDPTNVLALQAAVRRRAILAEEPRSSAQVSIATVHRVVRAQFLDRPGLVPHFGIAGLCTAGRDGGTSVFEVQALELHLSLYARWIRALDPKATLRVALTPLDGGPSEDHLGAGVFESLSSAHPNVECLFAPEREQGRGYYERACFKIHAELEGREEFELTDGGFTDWTAKLLSNRKERLLVSGAGLERLVAALVASR